MTDPRFFDALRARFGTMIPHVAELGIVLTEAAADGAEAELPIRPEFIGDTERGLIHTGIVTTLIDSAMGVAVLARIGAPVPIATLDLRVDYLQAARDGQALHCRAECYRMTTHIAFVRAQVWQHDPAQPVATAQAAFMVNSRRSNPPRSAAA
jgi:uncharacterized protein (TIGR00369 family)